MLKKFLFVFLIVLCSFSCFSTSHAAKRFITGYRGPVMINPHVQNEDLGQYNITGGPVNGSCSTCPALVKEIDPGYIKNADKYSTATGEYSVNHSCQNTGNNQFVSACYLSYIDYTYIGDGDDNGETTIPVPPVTPPVTPPVAPPTCTGHPESQDTACVFNDADIPTTLPSTDLTCEITPTKTNNPNDKEKFYNINDSFILSGNHHGICSLSSYTPVSGDVTCSNNPVAYTCTNPTCTLLAHNYWGACNKTSPGIIGYTDILYRTDYHNVEVSFDGFTVNDGASALTITPDPSFCIDSYSPLEHYQSGNLKITGINFSMLKQDGDKSYGKVVAKCPTCNNSFEFKIYFAFTPEVLDKDFSKALRATLISDLNYKDYFLSSDAKPYLLDDPKAVLVDDSKKDESAYSEALKTGFIKTGYAVSFALNTTNTPIAAISPSSGNPLYLQVNTTFVDKDNHIISPSDITDYITKLPLSDADYELFNSFISNNSEAINKFKITAESPEENEILWKWLYYMPPMLYLDPTDLEIGPNNELLLTVRTNIQLKCGNTVLWDYVKILKSEDITDWNGNIFKYDIKKSVLDDFDNTISN